MQMRRSVGFSEWIPWASRHLLSDGKGVYLFARCESLPPPERADPIHRNVIYVGQCGTKFKARWDLFDEGLNHPEKVAQNPKHYPRASRYLELYQPGTEPLYVATLTVEELCDGFRNPGTLALLDVDVTRAGAGLPVQAFLNANGDLLAKYVERRLILLYGVRYGRRPVINRD